MTDVAPAMDLGSFRRGDSLSGQRAVPKTVGVSGCLSPGSVRA
jgi:hypothetical protein